jgi:hypothetical protein
MNAFHSLNALTGLNALRAGLLSGSLLAGSCVGAEETDPLEPQGIAAIQTQATPGVDDLTAHADGLLYGSSTYAFSRGETERAWIVAAQISCPAGYFIEGSCTSLLRHPDDETAPHFADPFFNGICFNPLQGSDNGLEPCLTGALLCAVRLPGDRVETTTTNTGEETTTSSETILGADRADLRLDFRCLPSR